MQIVDELKCLATIRRFADDLEFRFLSKDRNQALPEYRMIIGNQNSYGLLHTSAAVSGGFSPNNV
jgi:hypothetical protein